MDADLLEDTLCSMVRLDQELVMLPASGDVLVKNLRNEFYEQWEIAERTGRLIRDSDEGRTSTMLGPIVLSQWRQKRENALRRIEDLVDQIDEITERWKDYVKEIV